MDSTIVFPSSRLSPLVLNASLWELCSDSPPLPGRAFENEIIKPMGISQRELARRLRMCPKHVNNIICGRKPFNIKFSARLKRHLGIDATRYMQLQMDLDRWRAIRDKEGAHPRNP